MPFPEGYEYPKEPWYCPVIRPDGSVCGNMEPTAKNCLNTKHHCRRCGREKSVASSLASYYKNGRKTPQKSKAKLRAEPMGSIITKGRAW